MRPLAQLTNGVSLSAFFAEITRVSGEVVTIGVVAGVLVGLLIAASSVQYR